MACGCTSTDGIGVTQDGALLDRTERAEHHPHVVLRDLLGQHAHKQFAFCHQKRALVDEYVNEDFSIQNFLSQKINAKIAKIVVIFVTIHKMCSQKHSLRHLPFGFY